MKNIKWNDDLEVTVIVYEGDTDCEKLDRMLLKNNYKHRRKKVCKTGWLFTVPCDISTIGKIFTLVNYC